MGDPDISLISTTVLGQLYKEIPLGPLYLAAALEKSGSKVEFRDFQLQPDATPYSLKLLSSFLLDESASVIGISCLADTLPLVILASAKVKNERPEKTIILGGPGPSGVAEKLLRNFPWIDIVVRGEGEETIVELLPALKEGALQKVKGITYRDNGLVISNPPRPRNTTLDELPYPAYHLVDWDQYGGASVITARGCPYRCAFCDVAPFWGHRTVFHRIGRTLEECLLLRHAYGIKSVSIVDDIFVLDRQRVMEFCQRLQKAQLDLKWACYARVDSIDEKAMEQMAEAGCTQVFYGLESGSDLILEQIEKGFKAEQAEQIVSLSTRYFGVTASFIVGFPFESMEDFYQTIHFAAQLSRNKVKVQLGLLMALPLSLLYSKYENRLTWIPSMISPLGVSPNLESNDNEPMAVHQLIQTYPSIFTGYFTYESPTLEPKIKVLHEGERAFHRLLGHMLVDNAFRYLITQGSTAEQGVLWQGTTMSQEIGLIYLFNLVRSVYTMAARHHLDSVAGAWQDSLEQRRSG